MSWEKPFPSFPTRSVTGASTSTKTISAVFEALIPSFPWILVAWYPWALVSTRMTLRRLWTLALSGPVTYGTREFMCFAAKAIAVPVFMPWGRTSVSRGESRLGNSPTLPGQLT